MRQPLSPDTSDDIERRQIEAWRAMPPEEKLRLVMQMNATLRQLALEGIRQRYPNASPREAFLRLAQLMLGDELARSAYPEIDTLDRP